MPLVPQLTIMRYFHHFSAPLAKGRLRDLRNAITLTETTERLTGLICCILNNNNPQNGSGAAAGSQKQNPLDGKTIPINCDTCPPRIIIALSKEHRLLTGRCGFFISSVKKTTRNGWISVTRVNQRRRSRRNCPVSRKPASGGWGGGGVGEFVMIRVDRRQDTTRPLMRARMRLAHECVQVSVFVCNPIR